jgi:hypothetical protein
MLQLTHHVQEEVVALAITLRVVAHARVVSGTSSADTLKNQALVTDDHPLPNVVTQQSTLKQDNTLSQQEPEEVALKMVISTTITPQMCLILKETVFCDVAACSLTDVSVVLAASSIRMISVGYLSDYSAQHPRRQPTTHASS